MVFQNRAEAAQLLARRLEKYRGQHPLVLAIPRGAVPMGKMIADALEGDLDVVLVRKLRARYNPELAIGSIDEAGEVYLDRELRDSWDEEYLKEETQTQQTTLRLRREQYQSAGAPIDPAGRIAIVLDDGVATGATMIAALRAVRAKKPRTLIAATAVASREALGVLRHEADEVICLEAPAVLYAIGYHFHDFASVSDDDAVAALQEARRQRVALVNAEPPYAQAPQR